MRIAAAAGLYFLAVFAVGFILGPVRVLVLEPRAGAVAAVLIEAPFLLLAIVAAAYTIPKAVRLERRTGALLAMGLGALAMQVVADIAVGVLLRGLAISEQITMFATTEGLIYEALLVLFAAMPVTVGRFER